MAVLIDVPAAGKPAAVELNRWAADQRVFISSVMADLAGERRAAATAIADSGAEPVWFEDFGGRDDDPQAAYLAEVASSSIYLGILARTYGRLLPSRLSATHEEYREAEARGLRISVWVHGSEDFQGDQRAFVDEIRQFHTTGTFTTPDDLAAGVTARLANIAAEELSPWCKLGDAIFRAHTIADTGRTVTVHATVTDPGVLAGLEALRPTMWGGQRDTRFTYAGRSYAVQVNAVTTKTTSSRATGVEITLDRNRDQDSSWPGFSVSFGNTTYTADDVTEISLRRALFGEPSPRGLLSVGGGIGDPLAELPATPLPVELHRAVLGLLITEVLVGSGRATRVTRLQISPPGPRGRRVIVEWTGRSNRNTPTQPRTVDGYLSA